MRAVTDRHTKRLHRNPVTRAEPNNYASRETAFSIPPAVTKLFNISLTLGKLPAEWKHALITPVPKSAEMAAVSNYCPISLLPLLTKVIEACAFITSKTLERN